jgi:chitin disaccharide deacetylase
MSSHPLLTSSKPEAPGIKRQDDRRTLPATGVLIINADDWGIDSETTDRIFDCVRCGSVSSASAMVFMADSQRAADLAREYRIDTGLHLNLTTPFTAPRVSERLMHHQQLLMRFLRGNRFARMVFHPALHESFKYVVAAQLEEFGRLLGAEPKHMDGHHHMHLCANVLFGDLLPEDIAIRRNFTFQVGEKGITNRLLRKIIDNKLAREHRIADFFFSLPPLRPIERLERIVRLAKKYVVEVETHPANLEEYKFLMDGRIFNLTGDVPIASGYRL